MLLERLDQAQLKLVGRGTLRGKAHSGLTERARPTVDKAAVPTRLGRYGGEDRQHELSDRDAVKSRICRCAVRDEAGGGVFHWRVPLSKKRPAHGGP